jgi:eukaryotic-like serine/threonine-protein kinase
LDLAPGLVVADRFRLERVLGQGGMGSVWLARQVALDVPCAVKFIHPEAARSADVRGRFEREAKAAAQLRSPHVVQILDHGVWQGAPYIAMELLVGEDLEHRLARQKTLPPRETAAIASQVGRALTRAHAAGLVHRDLKPANIITVIRERQPHHGA